MRSRAAPADDRRIRRFPLLARFAALGENARRATRVTAALAASLAAAHRVANRVLGHAALVRLAAHPALSSSLAQAYIHVFRIADHSDGRSALGTNTAHLT